MIKVIEQTTAERNAETRNLFNSIRPYLDDGHTYRTALIEVGRIGNSGGHFTQSWFRELTKYGETQGYPYAEYKGKRGRKKGSKDFKDILMSKA